MRKKYYKKKRKGVPKGYTHNWKYTGRWTEKKIKPRTWKIRFKATKGRKARTYGGFGKGTRIRWKIIAYQDAIKTSKGTYQTDMKGTKKLIRIRRK